MSKTTSMILGAALLTAGAEVGGRLGRSRGEAPRPARGPIFTLVSHGPDDVDACGRDDVRQHAPGVGGDARVRQPAAPDDAFLRLVELEVHTGDVGVDVAARDEHP